MFYIDLYFFSNKFESAILKFSIIHIFLFEEYYRIETKICIGLKKKINQLN